MKLMISGIFLIFSISSSALETGPYRLVGTVKSFDSEFITLDTGDAIVQVPRNIVKQPIVSSKKLSLILLPEQKDQLKIKTKKN